VHLHVKADNLVTVPCLLLMQ